MSIQYNIYLHIWSIDVNIFTDLFNIEDLCISPEQ
jgi:hypothetical protein